MYSIERKHRYYALSMKSLRTASGISNAVVQYPISYRVRETA